MYASSPGKQHHLALSPHTSTIDEMSPLAGTVGIELVPQTLALMADNHTDSGSSIQPQTGSDTQTASAPAEKQQQQQLGPQEGSQQQPLAAMLSDEESNVSQQLGEASRGRQSGVGSNSAVIEGQATAAVGSEHTSQQHQELQHHSHESGSADGHEADDEHAVLLAVSHGQPCDKDQRHAQAPEAKMSKQQSAAAERQRVWYKERAVQLTILG